MRSSGGREGADEEAELGRRFNMQMSSVSFRWRIKVWLFSTSFPLPLSSHPSLASRGLWVWQGLCVGNSGEWKGQGDPVEGTNFWGSVRSVWNKSVALLVLRTCSPQGVLSWAHNSRPVYSTLKYLRMGLGEKRGTNARGLHLPASERSGDTHKDLLFPHFGEESACA